MLVTYSWQSGWQTGLQQTFDGQHPCCHCKAIEKGRASEKKEQSGNMDFKLTATPEILLSTAVAINPPTVQKADWPTSDFYFSGRNHSPPTPPPLSSDLHDPA
jgi:hypothetical protein